MAYLRLDNVNDKMARTFRTGAEVLVNGNFVNVGVLENNNLGRDTYAIAKLTDVAGDAYAFIAHDGHTYDPASNGDISVPANSLTRGYLLSRGDVITIQKDLVANAVVVGDKLAPNVGGHKLAKAVAASVNVIAVVDAIEKYAGVDCYVIRFL